MHVPHVVKTVETFYPSLCISLIDKQVHPTATSNFNDFGPDICSPGSCVIYVICVCLGILVSKTYCVVFLFCFSSSCVPYFPTFSELSIFDCPVGIL